MDKERVINKITRDMRMSGLIALNNEGEERVAEVKFFMDLVWVAAQEGKTRELCAHNEKKVVLIDLDGKAIEEFDSAEKASRKLKIGVQGIYSAIMRRSRTKKGYYFRYADADTCGSAVDQGRDGGQ